MQSGSVTQNVWSPLLTDSLVLRDVHDNPGTLDPNAGDGGGITHITVNALTTSAYQSIADAGSGESIMAAYDTNASALTLTKLTGAGTPDTSFGGGIVTDSSSGMTTVSSLAIESDGKIVVVGTDGTNMIFDRFNADGTVDTTFGTGGGVTLSAARFPSPYSPGGTYTSCSATCLTMKGDKILLGGWADDGDGDIDFAVARLTLSGSLDTSFNTTGTEAVEVVDADNVNAITTTTISGSTYIIAAGTNGSARGEITSHAGLGIAMFHDDGSFNTSFDGDGMLANDLRLNGATRTGLFGAASVIAYSGGFYVAGNNADGGVTVYKYSNTGSTVSSFATSFGMDFLYFGVQSAGQFILGGVAKDANDCFTLVRFNADGTLDSGFGNAGRTDIADLGLAVPGGGVLISGDRITLMATANDPDEFGFVSAYFTGSASNQRLYAQQDANDDTTSLTSTSGTVLQRYVYDPYGQQTVLNASGSVTTDAYHDLYGFQGGRFDPTTGMINFRHRDYNISLGNWAEEDPAGYVDGADRTQFARSNPVSLRDPLGLTADTAMTVPNSRVYGNWVFVTETAGEVVLSSFSINQVS